MLFFSCTAPWERLSLRPSKLTPPTEPSEETNSLMLVHTLVLELTYCQNALGLDRHNPF